MKTFMADGTEKISTTVSVPVATKVTVADAAGDTTTYPVLVGDLTGDQAPLSDAGISYNATTNALTATTFVGALTGNAATVTVADAGGDTTTWPMLATSITGSLAPATDANLTYDATANNLAVPSVNLVTITAPATGSTLTIADGKTLTASQTVTLDGNNLLIGAEFNISILRNPLDLISSFLMSSGVAYWVYMGRVAKTCTPRYVHLYVRTVGAGAQTAELCIASSPAAPAGANQSLTLIEGTGTIGSLTSTGTVHNTSAFSTSVPAGTYLWAGFRTAMASTQPAPVALLNDMQQGCVLSTAASGVLSSGGPWTGALIADTTLGIAPLLRILV